MNWLQRAVGLALTMATPGMPALSATVPQPASEALPGGSLYQLQITLEPVGNAPISFATLQGKPLLVTMFYSHCASVCPLVTTQLQQLVAALAPAGRQRLNVLMVSFDALRDTPQALAAFKAEHHIRDANWLVAHGRPGDVRALAAALGIQYRELPDHSFNHSAVITLLDAQGVPRARTQSITAQDPDFLTSLTALLGTKPANAIEMTP